MTIDTLRETLHGLDRRSVLRGAAIATGLVALGPLDALRARAAGAAPLPFSADYGPLYPARDQTTGLELLLLPRGFEYLSFGWTGDVMGDGIRTPSSHDGMAAFRSGDAPVTLVRNHERGSFTGKFTDPAYDPAANGGTSNLLFDPDAGQFVDSWASLSGTIRNCAGGPTPLGVLADLRGDDPDQPRIGTAARLYLRGRSRWEGERVAADRDGPLFA